MNINDLDLINRVLFEDFCKRSLIEKKEMLIFFRKKMENLKLLINFMELVLNKEYHDKGLL